MTRDDGSGQAPKSAVEERLPLRPLDLSVLLALAHEELHGYAIAKRIAERELGGIVLAPGNLYAVLDRLLAAELVAERPGRPDQDARRRTFGITGLGRRIAAAEVRRLGAVVETARRLDLLSLEAPE